MTEKELLETIKTSLQKYRGNQSYKDLFNECVVAVWEREDLWDDPQAIGSLVRREAYKFLNFRDKLIPVSITAKNRKALSDARNGVGDGGWLESLLLSSEGFLEGTDTLTEDTESTDKMILEQDKEFLHMCIKLFLTDTERKVLTFYLQEDTSVQEVANWHGTTVQAVYATVDRAVEKLRVMFNNRENTNAD